MAAVVGAGFVFLLFRNHAGLGAARFILLALCANPLYWRTAVEAGTDMPAFALSIAATYFVLESRDMRGAFAAGLLAGAAILCRYNAAFLLPAGVIATVLTPSGPRRLLAYAAGVALLVAPWLLANQRLTGSAFTNRNYANLAYELYGRGMGWDIFWSDVAPRFTGFTDVLQYDPVGALLHWGRNLATRWLADVRQLVPVWLGVAAVLGAILSTIAGFRARRMPASPGLLAHFAFCYATLAFVFYTPRFFLFLVPIYLAAAAILLFPPDPWARRLRLVRLSVAGLALIASAVVAARETRAVLADQPYEIRSAGRVLRGLARPGDRLLARKPQVAYFADMEFVPLPNVETVRELLVEARRAKAPYLFLSGIEASLRPQFTLLNEGDVALPGFERLARETMDARHFYTLYRVSADTAGDAGFSDSLIAALEDMAERYADVANVQAYVGALLIEAGRHAEAIACLDRSIALDPSAIQPVGYRALARIELGQLEEAARDCELLLSRMERAPATFHLLLGTIRARQGRFEAAEAAFGAAAAIEPANAAAQLDLGLVRLARGNESAAVEPLERAVRLLPVLVPVRDMAVAAARSGPPGASRLVPIFEAVWRTGGGSGQIATLADSLGGGR